MVKLTNLITVRIAVQGEGYTVITMTTQDHLTLNGCAHLATPRDIMGNPNKKGGPRFSIGPPSIEVNIMFSPTTLEE